MKITAIQNKQPAFKGFEKLIIKNATAKSKFLDGILSAYASQYHKKPLLCIFDVFKDSIEDDMFHYSDSKKIFPQWFIENLKYHGVKIPENFMNGEEEVILATGLKDRKKLSIFSRKRRMLENLYTGLARFKYLFSSKYKDIPKESRYYAPFMEVLNKYNAHTDRFLAQNNAQSVTLRQIFGRIADSIPNND